MVGNRLIRTLVVLLPESIPNLAFLGERVCVEVLCLSFLRGNRVGMNKVVGGWEVVGEW